MNGSWAIRSAQHGATELDELLARVERTAPDPDRSDSYSNLTIARGKHICITCPVALRFEWRRVTDWVAYHSLLGVDCFVLFLDESKLSSDVASSAVALRVLLAAPTVKLFRYDCPDRHSCNIERQSYALVRGLERMRHRVRPKACMYIDVDEFVAVRALPLGASIHGALVRMANQLLARGDGVFLHRWQYGTSGYDAPPSLACTPEFGLLTTRRGVDYHGKLLLRVGRGVRLANMHSIEYGSNSTIRLADGSRISPRRWSLISEGAVGHQRQLLSINHFNTGSRQECLDKSRNTGIASSKTHRRVRYCAEYHVKIGRGEALKGGFVYDPLLARHAYATRAQYRTVFPNAAASVAALLTALGGHRRDHGAGGAGCTAAAMLAVTKRQGVELGGG